MTTTMFVQHILGFDRSDTEMRAARAAGWRRSDLWWERLSESGCARHLRGDRAGAAKDWHQAAWIARLRFPARDPRRATSLANLALADRDAGREGRARRRYARARQIWRHAESYIDTMQIARRARSSLFHMRMEALHWDTYSVNMKTRFRAFAGETAEALAALGQGRPASCRLFGRWRGEKPAVFDDSRKFLSAALLVGGDGDDHAGGNAGDPGPTQPATPQSRNHRR